MARYVDEYQGIHGDMYWTTGMDPNYRGGVYRGMRQREDNTFGPAAYGRYRWRHADDLGGEGGYEGLMRIRDYEGDYRRVPRGARGARGYDRDTGGVRDRRYDRGFLRQFNAHSPALREGGGYSERRVEDFRRGAGHPVDRDATYRWGYANRGLSSSGYGEAWARAPMRGSRER